MCKMRTYFWYSILGQKGAFYTGGHDSRVTAPKDEMSSGADKMSTRKARMLWCSFIGRIVVSLFVRFHPNPLNIDGPWLPSAGNRQPQPSFVLRSIRTRSYIICLVVTIVAWVTHGDGPRRLHLTPSFVPGSLSYDTRYSYAKKLIQIEKV